MARFTALTQGVHEGKKGKTAVLITNLGTPDAPTTGALRRYLREFLSDPRVVEIPRLVWMLILYCFILPFRPAKSARLYESIWTPKGSPLLAIAKSQRDLLAAKLADEGHNEVLVKLAMRYGQPSISTAMQELQQAGIDNLIVLPLYPQYAGPTTGSTFDAVTAELRQWRFVPGLHFINSYHDHPMFIDALAASIQRHFDEQGKPQKLVLSYHGTPKRTLLLGDPYYCMCQKTTRLVAEKLGLKEDEYISTFQSRFGKAEWLKPYTDETLQGLPAQGVKDIAVVCPAFSADCLETLEEISGENKEIFMHAGGEHFHYIPALNSDPEHIACLHDLVLPYLTTARQPRCQ